MSKSGAVLAACVAVLMMAAGQAWAQEKTEATTETKTTAEAKAPAKAGGPFVVAVLNFETGGNEATSSYGQAIPDLLNAFLTTDQNLQLVERTQIKKILDEMALGKTGIVDEESQAKIGKLTGAKFLITGRAMIVGNQLFIMAKVMSTETSKVGALVAKGSTDGKLDVIVQDLATKISAYMDEKAAEMMPKVVTDKDVIAALQKKLEGKTLPKFAVVSCEYHVGRLVIDPAIETEVDYLLKSVGATVISTKDAGLSDWAKDFLNETGKEIPNSLNEADVVIVGQGFSEFAGTTEKLISVKGRVEMKAVDVKSGKILAVGRETTTAVDLAENIAGKTALQKGASAVAAKLIPEAVDAWAKAQPAGAGEKPAPQK